jgi:hypothetical protein
VVEDERERELDEGDPGLLGELRELVGGVALALVLGERQVVEVDPVGVQPSQRVLSTGWMVQRRDVPRRLGSESSPIGRALPTISSDSPAE